MLLEEVLSKVKRNQQISIVNKKGGWIFVGEVSEWERTLLRTIQFELTEIYLETHLGDDFRGKIFLRVKSPTDDFSVEDLAKMVFPNTKVTLNGNGACEGISISAPAKVILKEDIFQEMRDLDVNGLYYNSKEGLALAVKPKAEAAK